ncbi:hypothetical protein [Larkinella soli]|uniref:hypothetical protein n=1 Tax=Larkinella soli TaxID=1770527 RepID=UPI000FFBF46D|nr:hypothetical protein [Larkinella soli]
MQTLQQQWDQLLIQTPIPPSLRHLLEFIYLERRLLAFYQGQITQLNDLVVKLDGRLQLVSALPPSDVRDQKREAYQSLKQQYLNQLQKDQAYHQRISSLLKSLEA